LKSCGPKINELSKSTKKVYGYFNNHFHGFAIENLLKTLQMTGTISAQQKEALKTATAHLEKRKEAKTERTESLLDYMSDGGGRQGRR